MPARQVSLAAMEERSFRADTNSLDRLEPIKVVVVGKDEVLLVGEEGVAPLRGQLGSAKVILAEGGGYCSRACSIIAEPPARPGQVEVRHHEGVVDDWLFRPHDAESITAACDIASPDNFPILWIGPWDFDVAGFVGEFVDSLIEVLPYLASFKVSKNHAGSVSNTCGNVLS